MVKTDSLPTQPIRLAKGAICSATTSAMFEGSLPQMRRRSCCSFSIASYSRSSKAHASIALPAAGRREIETTSNSRDSRQARRPPSVPAPASRPSRTSASAWAAWPARPSMARARLSNHSATASAPNGGQPRELCSSPSVMRSHRPWASSHAAVSSFSIQSASRVSAAGSAEFGLGSISRYSLGSTDSGMRSSTSSWKGARAAGCRWKRTCKAVSWPVAAKPQAASNMSESLNAAKAARLRPRGQSAAQVSRRSRWFSRRRRAKAASCPSPMDCQAEPLGSV
mmetsp:Transcript_39488/g.93707  ORF Transcript_39488/g.93707 Transcript_39488/m.93707 type:complete len:282 (+) Transcript_39488:4397-5242(+)